MEQLITLIGANGLDTVDGGEDSDIYLASHDKIDVYSDSVSNGIDVIRATGKKNFKLELDMTFDSSSGIEQIDGEEIKKTLEIRADYNTIDNIWDFSNIELVDVDLILSLVSPKLT
ncbi:MAG: hypothetical protein QNJ70_26115 [Xenococcaceae cyanobacterium MO_207.B15]|nr:hypothetical protein [Xenococcaceae cyanobacterium MO_207.B15]